MHELRAAPYVGDAVAGRDFLDLIARSFFGSAENAPRAVREWYVVQRWDLENSAGFRYYHWTTRIVLPLEVVETRRNAKMHASGVIWSHEAPGLPQCLRES